MRRLGSTKAWANGIDGGGSGGVWGTGKDRGGAGLARGVRRGRDGNADGILSQLSSTWTIQLKLEMDHVRA